MKHILAFCWHPSAFFAAAFQGVSANQSFLSHFLRETNRGLLLAILDLFSSCFLASGDKECSKKRNGDGEAESNRQPWRQRLGREAEAKQKRQKNDGRGTSTIANSWQKGMGNDNEGTEDDNEGTEDDNADNDDEGHNEDNNLGNNKLDNDEVKYNDGNDVCVSGCCMLFSMFFFYTGFVPFFGNFLIPLCLLSGHWPYASSLRTFFVHFLNLFRPSGYLAEAACHQACKSNRGF